MDLNVVFSPPQNKSVVYFKKKSIKKKLSNLNQKSQLKFIFLNAHVFSSPKKKKLKKTNPPPPTFGLRSLEEPPMVLDTLFSVKVKGRSVWLARNNTRFFNKKQPCHNAVYIIVTHPIPSVLYSFQCSMYDLERLQSVPLHNVLSKSAMLYIWKQRS